MVFKYYWFLILMIAVVFVLLPVFIAAQDGLVPCSGLNCTFCDFFRLFQNILNFVANPIVPFAATGLIIYGGYLFLTGGSNPGQITKAKSVLSNTVVGLVITYAAFGVVTAIIGFVAKGTTNAYEFGFRNGGFSFACQASSPEINLGEGNDGNIFSIGLKEERPVIKEGKLSTVTIVGRVGTVTVSDSDVNVNGLVPLVQEKLIVARQIGTDNDIELVVTSASRTLEKQRALVAENCDLEASTEKCVVLPGKKLTCIPNADGSNCPHTTGKAVDVWGRQNGVQCKENDNCQNAVIKIMKQQGFCVLNSEPWHFEQKNLQVSKGLICD